MHTESTTQPGDYVWHMQILPGGLIHKVGNLLLPTLWLVLNEVVAEGQGIRWTKKLQRSLGFNGKENQVPLGNLLLGKER